MSKSAARREGNCRINEGLWRVWPEMAVPARMERLWGAQSASELALAGTFGSRAKAVCLATLAFGAGPSFDGGDYTTIGKTVNDFL